jgi:hemolysin D
MTCRPSKEECILNESLIYPSDTIPISTDVSCRTIRVLLADDQMMVLEFLKSFLAPEADIHIIGSANSGEATLELVSKLQPDIALIDVEMPDMDGIAITRSIMEQFAHTKVLMFSSHNEDAYIRNALAAGARGYLLKGTPAQEIIHAIRYVQKGYLQLGPGLFEKLDAGAVSLLPSSAPTILEVAPAPAPLAQTTTAEITASELEWSPYAEDQINALPQAWTRGLLYFLIAFAAIALPWSMLAKVDETGVARGRIEPEGATQRLDSPTSGTVAAVRVKEGQAVTKGQVLVELDADVLRTELQQAQAKLAGQISQLNQLEILKNQVLSTLSVQAQQNQAQALEKLSQVGQARQSLSASQVNAPLQDAEKLAQVEQAEARLNAAQTDLIRVESRYQRDLDEVKRYQRLARSGVVPAIKVVELERSADESSRLCDQATAEIQQAQKSLTEKQKGYQSLRQKLQAEQTQADLRLQEQQGGQATLSTSGELSLLKNQEQLKQLESQSNTLKSDVKQSQSQVQALNLQMEQRIVRSPVTGTIFEFPTKKAKAFVQAGQLIAQIAPQNAPLIVKGQIPSINSGFLKVGQPVKLKFDAYPFQDYGVVSGHLRWISPNSKVVEVDGGKAEIFDLDVTLDQPYIQTATKQIMLTPGQAATAEVIVRQRRIIDFLLDPFQKLRAGGLRL